jgi:hypothetical protein
VFDDAGGGTASCYDSGTGNNVTSFPGYTFIEKDETAGGASSGWMTSDVVFGTSLTGTISIDPHIANQNLLLVLKSGVGNGDPDWVVFALTPTILSSAFSIVSPGPGSQALSHMELYGGRGPIPAPEPASLLLFGTGLLGVGRAARKRLHASRPEASE